MNATMQLNVQRELGFQLLEGKGVNVLQPHAKGGAACSPPGGCLTNLGKCGRQLVVVTHAHCPPVQACAAPAACTSPPGVCSP